MDFDAIKKIYGLAITNDTTYITWPRDTVVDMNGNAVVEIERESAMVAYRFIPDSTPPELTYWDLNLTSAVLTLYFSETINASSFNVSQVRIQSNSTSNVGFNLRSGASTIEDGLVVQVWITKEDLDEIKRIEEIATSLNNTYLSYPPSLIQDMNSNQVVPRLADRDATRVRVFTPDSIPPELISFDLDMNQGILLFTFSETVNASSLAVELITLVSSPERNDSDTSFTLTGGNFTLADSIYVSLTLSKMDLDSVKERYLLAISMNTTFLVLERGAILDQNDNPLVPLPLSDPMPVNEFTEDITPPELVSFDLDMNSNQLILTFSETVDVSTFELTEIILLDSNGSASTWFQLTASSNSTMENSTTIVVYLSTEDSNEIRRWPSLAVSHETTFISFSSLLVDDMNSNNVTAIEDHFPQRVTVFTMDLTPPELLRFDFDVNTGVLTLYFSETVNTTSLDVSEITVLPSQDVLDSICVLPRIEGIQSFLSSFLQGEFNVSECVPKEPFRFSAFSTRSLTPYNDIVEVNVGYLDLNYLKRIRGLATAMNTTYLALNNLTIFDMNDNAVVPIPSHKPLRVYSYTADSTAPQLSHFNLSIEVGELVLSFDEFVDTRTLNLSTLTLQYSVNSSMFGYTLAEGQAPNLTYTTSGDGDTVVAMVGVFNLNDIKKIKELARESGTTFLSFSSQLVSDMAGNQVVPRDIRNAVPVTSFEPDITGPVLLSFSLDLTSETLIVTFDETVDVSTLNVSLVTLLAVGDMDGNQTNSSISFFNSSISFFTLTDARSITTEDGPVVEILLAIEDLHQLKLMRGLASLDNNTYIELGEQAIFDNALSANPNLAQLQGVSVFVPDRTSPRVVMFTVNVNVGRLTLFFDEPVDRSTLDVTQLVLQADDPFSSFDQVRQLIGGFSNSTDGLQMEIYLSKEDLDAVKRSDKLFIDQGSSYLTFNSSLISDIAGNPVMAVRDGGALQAFGYVNDTTMPVLISFNLDMNTGQLTLLFSETVNVSSVQLNQLTLQRLPNTTNEQFRYSLTMGRFLSLIDDPTVYIQLSLDDLNQLKIRTIADSAVTTFLTFPSTAVLDMNSQMVESRTDSINPAQVSVYTPDATSPVLEAFSVNITTELITLYFSETVNVERTFDVSVLTLQNSEQIDRSSLFSFYTLTNDSSSNSTNGPVAMVTIGPNDLNEIKKRDILAVSRDTTYVSFPDTLISDMALNPVVAVPANEGKRAEMLGPDTIRPFLVEFSLDLTSEVLSLTFSETVDLSTLEVTQLTVLQGVFPGIMADSYTLTGGFAEPVDAPIVDLVLSDPDLNIIKQKYTLAVDENSTFLSITEDAVRDMVGLKVVPIPSVSAQQVTTFFEDTITPRLVSFTLDLDGPGQLALTFSETVNADSLDVGGIVQQGKAARNDGNFYFLQTSSSTSRNGTIIVLDLSLLDSNEIKRNDAVATSSADTFLSIAAGAILDMNRNPVQEVAAHRALKAASYISDTTQPDLTTFDIDLTYGNLTLYFSEVVRAATFDPTQLNIQNGPMATPQGGSFILTGGSWVMADSNAIFLTLTPQDLNNLKRLPMVASHPNNSFITYTSNLVSDMAGNAVVPRADGSGLPSTKYGFDVVMPTLVAFVVDFDSGELVLTFSEAVNLSSLHTGAFTIQDCCFYTDITVDMMNQTNTTFNTSSSGNVTANNSTNMTDYEMQELVEMLAIVPLYTFTLTGGSYSAFEDTIITYDLTDADLNELKRRTLCANENDGADCCISLTGEALRDIAGNPIEPIFQGCGFSPTTYTPDTNRPSLVEFTLFDLDEGQITLIFNETINASTVDPRAITLQSFSYQPAASHQLTGGTVVSMDSTVLVLNLTKNDLDEVKRQSGLCSVINQCWLSFTEALLSDVAENVVVNVPSNKARYLQRFISDDTAPSLLGYVLNLENMTLTLTFDEPVDSSSVSLPAVTFFPAPDDLETVVQLTGGASLSTNDLTIVVDLLTSDVNNLKLYPNLATDINNTFISVGAMLIRDTDANYNNPILMELPLMASDVIEDTSPPQVTRFSLDLNTDQLVLYFDEPVNASTLEFTAIQLYSAFDSLYLSGGDIDQFQDEVGVLSITVNLTWDDVDHLKLSPVLATSAEDTFLALQQGAVKDMSDNPITALPVSRQMQAAQFMVDVTRAELVSFVLDMNTAMLLLTFNDVINSSTLYIRAFTVQNMANIGMDYVILMNEGTTNSSNGHYITIGIDNSDLNRIKVNTQLATSINDSFLAMRAAAFEDNFGRDVIAVITHRALPASGYIPDRTAPYLIEFTLDLTSNVLLLIFNEVINASSVDPQELVLQSGLDINGTEVSSYQLQNSTSTTRDSTMITIQLAEQDLNEIKLLFELAVSRDTTYLSFSSGLASDMNGNAVEPVANSSAQMAMVFTEDRVPPRLVSFDIDLTFEELVVTFSETVDASTVDIIGFTLQGREMRRSHYTLQSSTWDAVNSTNITIFLSTDDLNEVKILEDVATSLNDTYLTLASIAVMDMNGNPVTPRGVDEGLQASSFFGDTIRPVLFAFSLNLSSEILTLSFSETVRSSTLDVHNLILQSNSMLATAAAQVALTGGLVLSDNSPIINVELSTADLNRIKQLVGLATLPSNTFLSVIEAAILDMSDLPLMPVPHSLAFKVQSFYRDFVKPTLDAFTLDLDVGNLLLTFSETVNASSFYVTQITLQNAEQRNGVETHFTLTASSTFTTENSPVVVVDLSAADLNEIKRLDQLATTDTSTFISITSSLVADMNANDVVAILPDQGLKAEQFIADTNSPQIVEFDLNLNSGQLVLRFNETVMAITLDVEGLVLQYAEDDNLYSFTPSRMISGTISPDGTEIVVRLGEDDLNDLKRLREVATSANNTFLTMETGSILDMSGNPVVGLNTSEALNVSVFTNDQTLPQLRSFSLDMNTGALVLNFSETVQFTTLDLSAFTLHPSRMQGSMSHTLTPGSGPLYSEVVSLMDDPILLVQLGSIDLNTIKQLYELATLPSNTYLSVTNQGVRDMVGLPLEPINASDTQLVAAYVGDTEGPILLSFSLDLSNETLMLTFDETINIDSFDITYLTVVSGSSANQSNTTDVPISGYRSISDANSTVINITLALQDLHQIKLLTDLAVSVDSTYLTIEREAVTDMAYYPNEAQESTIPVELFLPDLVDPELMGFVVDLNAGTLTVSFDEPVNVSSVNFSSLTLLSSRLMLNGSNTTSLAPVRLTLRGGFTNSSNGLMLTLHLLTDDLNAIKERDELLVSQGTSYISLTTDFISDMAGNPTAEVPPEDAVRASAFYNDTTRPILSSFTLDMNTGVLILTFPETVDAMTVMYAGLTLQKAAHVIGNADRYMLSGGDLLVLEDRVTVTIAITSDDLNEIKRRRIALSPATTWLAMENTTIVDMFDLPVVPLANGFAQQVGHYISDTTPPTLDTFSLDMNTGRLVLNFSETVSVNNFNVTALRLQDTQRGEYLFNHFMLTEGSMLRSPSGTSLEVELGLSDTNEIKRILELAIDRNSTFLSLTSDLVRDVFGNPIISINVTMALRVSQYYADSTSPEILMFELDLDNQTLTLYLDETVNASSLDVTQFTLSGGPGAAYQSFTLMSSMSLSVDGTIIVIDLSTDDFNSITNSTELATDMNNTYLSWTASALFDVSMNNVKERALSDAQEVMSYSADMTPPELMYFDLDMDGVFLTLYFTETVNVSSIDFTAITLQASGGALSTKYTLQTGEVLSPNGATVVVQVQRIDEDEIKKLTSLATASNNTFISVQSFLVLDMNANPLVSIPRSGGRRVQRYIPDTTQPRLDAFDLDLSDDVLYLEFTETVNASSLLIPGLILHSEEEIGNDTQSHILNDSMVVLVNGPILTIWLSRFDRDEIRRLARLAVDPNTTFLSVLERAVFDMVGLPINTTTQPVRNYTADSVRPYLENFTLDLTTELLTLSFSEVVDITTIDISQATISDGNDQNFTLTGGVVANRDNSAVVVTRLSTLDLNDIKLLTSLAVSLETTFLSFTAGLLTDMNSNRVLPVTVPEMAAAFTEDEKSPQLVAFDVDMNAGNLTLTFSESVNSASLDVSQITLQGATGNLTDVEFHVLSYLPAPGSYTPSTNGTQIVVQLSREDLNRIKQLQRLAISNRTTFISITMLAILDMNDNYVEAIDPQGAQIVQRFTEDVTPPELESFTLDVNDGTITLFFDETVNVSSTRPAGLALQSMQVSTSASLSIVSDAVSAGNSPEVTVFMDSVDLNLLKSDTGLGTNINNTFLTVLGTYIEDMNGNAVTPIVSARALQASEVVPDSTQPELTGFDFDLNVGTLTLMFNESVNVTSLQVDRLTVVSVTSDESVVLAGFTTPLVYNTEQTVIAITLLNSDQNRIKYFEDLATLDTNTFIKFTADLVSDNAGNPVLPLNETMVDNYTRDSTCPELKDNGHSFDLDVGTLCVCFKETVNASSLRVTSITLLNDPLAPTASYLLTGGTVQMNNSDTLCINLTLDDLNRVKSMHELASVSSNAYVHLAHGAVKDMADNDFCNNTAPQNVVVSLDTVPPTLEEFCFDIDSGVLTLTFSEPLTLDFMSVQLRPEQIVISDPNCTYQVSLTGGSVTVQDPPNIVNISMVDRDFFLLQSMDMVGTSEEDTFLAITSKAATDFGGNDLLNYSCPNPLAVSSVKPDLTPPVLLTFRLDLNANILTLTFTEYINVSTFNPMGLTLVNGTNGSVMYTLADSSALMADLTAITVNLSALDANSIRALTDVATRASDTYLTVQPKLIADSAFLPVAPIGISEAIWGILIPDTTPPSLVSFTLNLTSEVLSLTFDETVNAASLRQPSLQLQTDPSGGSPGSVVLMNGFVIPSDNSPVVDVLLSKENLNDIKRNTDLATSDNNTCLAIQSAAIYDLTHPTMPNPLLSGVVCADVDEFEPDLVRPQLSSFGVNLNGSTLLLVFDEPVNASTLDVTQITLQATTVLSSDPDQSHRLTGGEYFTDDLITYTVYFTENDLNEIKRKLPLLRSSDSTHISITMDLVVDMNNNENTPILASSALGPGSFQDDSNQPVLESFDMDMNTGTLTLHFSETVDISSLRFDGISLQQMRSSTSDTMYALTNGDILTEQDSPDVVIILTNSDLNELKARHIGLTNTTLFITLDNATITDIVGQTVVKLVNGINALPVDMYTTDYTPPQLDAFTLDLTSEVLVLSFNETVSSLVTVTEITISDGSGFVTDQRAYPLTISSFTTDPDMPRLTIRLSVFDLNELKKREGLATNINNTFLSFSSLTLTDVFGNPVVPISLNASVMADVYVSDIIPPLYTRFSLDMDNGVLTLTFSETVNSTSLDTTRLTFHNAGSGATQSYMLVYPYVSVTAPSDVVNVTIDNNDLNVIKNLTMLAVDVMTTYLEIAASGITDQDGNAISTVERRMVDRFEPDLTPPELIYFVIDLDSGVLTMEFNETINFQSVQPTFFALRHNATIPADFDPETQHQLTEGSTLSPNSPQIQLQILKDDLNDIKRKEVCTRQLGVADCFLVYVTEAVKDMADNPIQGCRTVTPRVQV